MDKRWSAIYLSCPFGFLMLFLNLSGALSVFGGQLKFFVFIWKIFKINSGAKNKLGEDVCRTFKILPSFLSLG